MSIEENNIRKYIVLNNLNCAHCAGKIEEEIKNLEEVNNLTFNFTTKKMSFEVSENVDYSKLLKRIKSIVHKSEPDVEVVSEIDADEKIKKTVILENLTCAHCAEKIRESVSELEGISNLNFNFVTKKLSFEISKEDDYKKNVKLIEKIIKKIEPEVKVIIDKNEIEKSKTNNNKIYLIIFGLIMYVLGIYLEYSNYEGITTFIIFIGAYLIIGFDVLYKAFRNIINGKIFDENFLMTIATIGAIGIGESTEAVGVMIFYKVGEYLQERSVEKSRKSISELIDIKAEYANLKVGDKIEVVKPESLKVNDIIIVKNGEKIPVDGVILDGISSLDTSMITGESIYKDVQAGDKVLSGTINKGQILTLKVDKVFSDSTVAKILDLIENSGVKKAKTENFITKFAKYYTPTVLIVALGIAFIPAIFSIMPISESLYRGLIFLVVSCPCALLLSIPLGFFSGIGYASKEKVLVKGSIYLELLKDVDTVVLDKTGTITEGEFEVSKVITKDIEEKELLKYAKIAEINSNHPIAKSIIRSSDFEVDINNIEVYEEIAGLGVKVIYNGETILLGNNTIMDRNNIAININKEIGTVINIAVNGIYKGYIVISDKIKEDSYKAIEDLKNSGVKDIIMITGDNEFIAEEVSKKIGITEYFAGLLPKDKVNKLEEIMIGKKNNKKVIFVGDGINDAPVLRRADIGISMGGVGSDAAIEASDVVIMNDKLSKIAVTIKIAKKTNRIIIQNIVLCLVVKIGVMILGGIGHANMWEAILADVGVALLCVLNAMRILKNNK